MLKVSTIIPCHNRKEITLKCLSSLRQIPCSEFQHFIYLVDDQSTDGTRESVQKQFHDQVTILDGNGSLFWTGAINMGIQKALNDQCDVIHLMNDDVIFDANFLKSLVQSVKVHSKTIFGSITCSIEDPSKVVRGGVFLTDYKIWPWVEIKGESIEDEKFKHIYHVDSLSGRSVCIPSVVFKKIGLFNQKKFPHNFADLDFFFRAKKYGFNVMINPGSLIYTDIEPKFIERLHNQSKINAIKDLWLDRKYFSIITFWHLSKHARHRFHYMAYIFSHRIKWTFLTFIRNMN